MPIDKYNVSETDEAFEKLILKKNGQRKTVTDVFEALVAIHHDSKGRDGKILDLIQRHLDEDFRMSNDEFEDFMGRMYKLGDERDKRIDVIKEELDEVRELVKHVECVAKSLPEEHKEFHQEFVEEMGFTTKHRATDGEEEDFTPVRSRRYTKEQIVTAVILLASTVGLNAVLTYIIVHALETAFN